MNNFKNSYAFVLKSIKKDTTLKPLINDLSGMTYLVSGATRGIGFYISKLLAEKGANVSMIGKTTENHPKLENTIYSARDKIINETKNHNILPIKCDIRNYDNVVDAVKETKERFSSIDGLVLNASALCLNNTLNQTKKEIDLMSDVNIKGTFTMAQESIKHMNNSANPHILVISPPLQMLENKDWWTDHLFYSMSKFNMSLMAKSWHNEFPNIGVNTLWPRTTIDTAPVRNLLGGEKMVNISRKPEIMATSAVSILRSDFRLCSGNNYIDDEVCASLDIDVEKFKINNDIPEKDLMPDFFC